MNLSDLTCRVGEWLSGSGPMQDVVISSRGRLARNLAGVPFLSRCTETQQQETERKLRGEILEAGFATDMFYVDIANASEMDRRLLVERHLISHQQGQASHPCGVGISTDETIAIMVNEEDHLRIQSLRSGLQLHEAIGEINEVDDKLEGRLDFAFHSKYGYLTACPTNVGTGLRVISNQTTLGKSEEQIVEEFVQRTIPQFIQYERRARQGLLNKDPAAIDDKSYRSLALLRSARTISSDEAMYLLSLVRLGIYLERINDADLAKVNELFLLTQPAHLQRILKKEMDARQRGEARAEFIRTRLSMN